jgi:hypothetical protein
VQGDLEVFSQTFGAAYAKQCAKNFDNSRVKLESNPSDQSFMAARVAIGSIPVPWLTL